MKRMNSGNHFLSFLTLLFFIGLLGCNGNNPADNSASDIDFDSGEFAIFGFNDAMDAVQDGSLESEMGLNSAIFNGAVFREGGPFGRRGPRGPAGPRMSRERQGNHLGKILRELSLTEEQKNSIRVLMDGHRSCIQEPLQALRDAIQPLIDSANEERRAIVDSVRAGELSRDQARERIRALNEKTRSDILNNPELQPILQAMCDCKLALLDDIRALLDDAQQIKWDEWVAGLQGPCFESTG